MKEGTSNKRRALFPKTLCTMRKYIASLAAALCLGGWVYLTNSRTDADFIVKETSANDYDCAIRIVDKSSPDCDEWRITSERALAKHKVYIAPQNELGYDYKVRIIR